MVDLVIVIYLVYGHESVECKPVILFFLFVVFSFVAVFIAVSNE